MFQTSSSYGYSIQHTNESPHPLTLPGALATMTRLSHFRANNKITMESVMTTVTVSELPSFVGKDLGHSEWLLIDQDRVNQFADCTGDHQFIHIDEEKAKQTPFGGTIAHGFLSLSLIPALSAGLAIRPEGLKMAVNYGLDSVRFIQPVRVGSRVRMQLTVVEVTEKNPGQWLVKSRATLEIEGVEKPAYIAETLALYFV